MSADALALILGAAGIHAAWNLLAKRAKDQAAFLFLATAAAAALGLPLALFALATASVPAPGLAAAAASGVVHAAYFALLGAGYRRGDLSVVYPVARGSSPLLVALLARPLLGDHLSPLGWTGVAVIVTGLALVAGGGIRGQGDARGGLVPAGVGLGLAVGVTSATYSLVDRAGVAVVAPPIYLALQILGAALLMAPGWLASGARRARLAEAARGHGLRLAVACGAGILGAYGLVLTAMRLAPLAYVVAGRELAIVFGTALGALVLKERVGPLRAAGAAGVMLGIVLLAFA